MSSTWRRGTASRDRKRSDRETAGPASPRVWGGSAYQTLLHLQWLLVYEGPSGEAGHLPSVSHQQ